LGKYNESNGCPRKGEVIDFINFIQLVNERFDFLKSMGFSEVKIFPRSRDVAIRYVGQQIGVELVYYLLEGDICILLLQISDSLDSEKKTTRNSDYEGIGIIDLEHELLNRGIIHPKLNYPAKINESDKFKLRLDWYKQMLCEYGWGFLNGDEFIITEVRD